MTKLKFHHTGILVKSIEDSLAHYSSLFGKENISEIFYVSSQKVKVCFVKNGEKSFLELVEPTDDSSTVSGMLKKRISYYHVAYLVKNIKGSIEALEKLNYKSMELFSSEAFEGRLCVFMFTPDGHLIELIEE